MGASRTLRRKLDADLIERLANGVKYPAKPIRKVKKPRAAATYRGARRNERRVLRAAQLFEKRRAA